MRQHSLTYVPYIAYHCDASTYVCFHFDWFAVPQEEDGPNLTLLEERLTTLRAGSEFRPTPRRPFWCLMYLIPDHHNPTGTSISEGETEHDTNRQTAQ